MKKPATPPIRPPLVETRLRTLQELTGTAATAVLSGRSWHIEHANERVRATCTYTPDSRGRWKYFTALYVDGQQRPNVKSLEVYAQLFADPDLKGYEHSPLNAIPKLLALEDGATLPPAVTALMDKLPPDLPVITGRPPRKTRRPCTCGNPSHTSMRFEGDAPADRHRFALQVELPSGTLVQVHFGAARPGRAGFVAQWMLAVDKNGRNLADQFEGDVNAAMAGILGRELPSFRQAGVAAPPTDTRGARDNGVQVRRATVIRT